MFFSKDDAQRLFDIQVQAATLCDMYDTSERTHENIKDNLHTCMKLIADQTTQITELCESINSLTGIIVKIAALLSIEKSTKTKKIPKKKKSIEDTK